MPALPYPDMAVLCDAPVRQKRESGEADNGGGVVAGDVVLLRHDDKRVWDEAGHVDAAVAAFVQLVQNLAAPGEKPVGGERAQLSVPVRGVDVEVVHRGAPQQAVAAVAQQA